MKYQITGEVDKTRVYPIRYIISMELPEAKIILFENLEYNEIFADMDFEKPIGYFRHESIRQFDKNQYQQLYDELFDLYDKIINVLLFGEEYDPEEERRMAELLKLLIEPSLLPMYKKLDKDFYNKYLRG